MKVLVVDDNKNARKLLVKILVSNNYEAIEATNGKEALEILKCPKPDLIISDIMMPEMDGFTLIKETKKNMDTRNIPFVFYTAHYVSENDRLLATSLGASRFIVKPVEPNELLQEIQNVLEEYNAGLIKSENSTIKTDGEYFKKYSESLFRKLEDKYAELEKTKNFLDTVLETMGECVIAVDPWFNVTYYNQKVGETIGYELRTGDKLPHVILPYETGQTRVPYHTFESRMYDRQRGSIYLEGSVSPTESENGECTGYIIVFRDITERKKTEKELLLAKLEAESVSRAKSEFLSNMSHELRTPLTAILGFSDILSAMVSGDLNETQIEYVSHINKSGKHLLELIDDILDISKIETGGMELKREIFSVTEVFDDVFARMKPKAETKNINLIVENNLPVDEIFADRLKFKLILSSLLSNAIKFTPDSGNVLLTACMKDNEVCISISDTGIGIPEHWMHDIFNPFVQVDASSKRRYGGTGLGLALVKWFVEMHNGNIDVESEEGKGSTFTFTIADQTTENVAKDSANKHHGKKMDMKVIQ